MGGLGILLILDLLVFVPLTAWLAQQKGRSWAEGAIVGAAIGFIGFLAIGLAPKSETPPKPLSTISKVLLGIIALLVIWIALGTPGMSALY